MTQGFDEWYNEAKKTNDDGFSAKDFYKAGAASRQAEINDSENTRAVLYRENMDLRESNIELQKRIDDALLIVGRMAKATNSTAIWSFDLDKALKGESNE